jgi:hypothetical protein
MVRTDHFTARLACPPVTEFVYRERLSMNARGWGLLAVSLVMTFLIIHPLFVAITAGAWLFNVLYFRDLEIRIDDELVWVGAKSAPLAALDPATLDRASNTWPWKTLSKDWLGANPIWTRDSLSLTGEIEGRRVRLNVGTDHRDELMAALLRGMAEARIRQPLLPPQPAGAPRPGWYVDPWNPVVGLRWWDGVGWTAHVAFRQHTPWGRS